MSKYILKSIKKLLMEMTNWPSYIQPEWSHPAPISDKTVLSTSWDKRVYFFRFPCASSSLELIVCSDQITCKPICHSHRSVNTWTLLSTVNYLVWMVRMSHFKEVQLKSQLEFHNIKSYKYFSSSCHIDIWVTDGWLDIVTLICSLWKCQFS